MAFQIGLQVKRFGLVAAVAATALATVAVAQTPDAAAVVQQRQAGMKELGAASKALNGMKSGELSPAEAQKAASVISTHAGAIPGWFPTGSGPEAGLKTKARAEIWTDNATFATSAQKLGQAAQAVSAAAQAGDKAAFGSAVDQVNGTCGGCHKAFRAS